jgi:arylsulfatase A-like enzyme
VPCVCPIKQKGDKMKKKNVIWIVSDQHRAQAMSCHGDPNVNTPNMDRMAIYGTDFRNAVSGFPLCCPFRGSMLTSIYPHKCVPGHDYCLPDGQKTIASVFNKNDYDTAYFGKWHVGSQLKGTGPDDTVRTENELRDVPDGRGRPYIHIAPERRGEFKTWKGYESSTGNVNVCLHGHDTDGEIDAVYLPGFETQTLTDQFMDYLKTKKMDDKEPFFAVLSVVPPHDPYWGPEEYMEKHNPNDVKLRPNVPDLFGYRDQHKKNLAGYYAMIEDIDKNIGRIRSYLEESGLDRDTHVIYFSDHGDSHGSQGLTTKMNPYEESMRIPFLLQGAQSGRSAYGNRGNSTAVLNHVDIATTTLGLCGISAPEWMEGYDYSHHYFKTKKDDEPQAAYIQQVVPTGHPNSIGQPWRGVVTRDGWKYVCTPGMDWLMFNLNEDKYEQRNLTHHESYFEKREELRDILLGFIEKTGDSFELPPKLNTFNSMSIDKILKEKSEI